MRTDGTVARCICAEDAQSRRSGDTFASGFFERYGAQIEYQSHRDAIGAPPVAPFDTLFGVKRFT